jgi:hypothetical protein
MHDHIADVERPEPCDGRWSGKGVERPDVLGIARWKAARVAIDQWPPVRGRREEPEAFEVRGVRLVHRQYDDGVRARLGGQPRVRGSGLRGDAHELERHGPGLQHREAAKRGERDRASSRPPESSRDGGRAEPGQTGEAGRHQDAEAPGDSQRVEPRDVEIELRVEGSESPRPDRELGSEGSDHTNRRQRRVESHGVRPPQPLQPSEPANALRPALDEAAHRQHERQDEKRRAEVPLGEPDRAQTEGESADEEPVDGRDHEGNR